MKMAKQRFFNISEPVYTKEVLQFDCIIELRKEEEKIIMEIIASRRNSESDGVFLTERNDMLPRLEKDALREEQEDMVAAVRENIQRMSVNEIRAKGGYKIGLRYSPSPIEDADRYRRMDEELRKQ